ncbi:MAG: S1/P1 nuclease [Candidatus Sericytochromatia bacterium]
MKRWKKSLSASLLALGMWGLSLSPALAWWETGHMITAQIGYDNLRPEVRTKADKLVAWLDNAEPEAARHGFVPVAVWMDDTKARGLHAFDQWHYINIPYNPEGLARVEDAKETNIVERMESMAETLRSDKTSDFEKAFALRILLHLFGDVHQPFHAVGKHSHEFPQGDLGGNRTLIQHGDIKNIHAFWDSTAGLFAQVKPPDWQGKIPGFALEVERRHPRSQFTTRLNFKPMAWAEESYALAVKYGYEPLPVTRQLSPEYISQAQQICDERLALGGYRLAELLNSVL